MIVRADIRQLYGAAQRAGASGRQIYQAIARGMYRAVNPLRDEMRAVWRRQSFKRGGRRLTRRAIARSVRSMVRRRGEHIIGIVGLRARGANRRAALASILEVTHRRFPSGAVTGKYTRMQMQPRVAAEAAQLQRNVAIAAQQIIAGNIRGRGSRR